MVTEQEKLTARFQDMERDGLVDVKFYLRNTDEATVEDVCREVSDMLDAFDRGEVVPLDFKDATLA